MARRIDANLVAMILCVIGGLALWTFSVETSSLKRPEPPAGLARMAYVDGLVTEVEQDRFAVEVRTAGGVKEAMAFDVREEDAFRFDFAHLRDHAADNLSTRVYYEVSEGRYHARWADDSPAKPRP